MLNIEYTDLVTPSQVADLSMDTLGDQITAAMRQTIGSGDTEAQQIQQAALKQIKAASSQIDQFLNRKLVINLATTYSSSGVWMEAPEFMLPNDPQKWRMYFKQFPVVQVLSADDDTDLAGEVAIMGDAADMAVCDLDGDLTQLPTRVAAFAGFKRYDIDAPASGETWNTVMSTSKLTGLDESVVLEDVPADICQVCATIVIAQLRWQFKELIGVTESSMSADRMSFSSRKQVKGFVEDQLESLRRHRKTPF